MNESVSQLKKPLVILTGPTAVGKTDLSIGLAKMINGEIISADSAQVYRGMDVGSAKVTPEEMQGIPHHLIDVLDPDEPFDVTVFQRLAKEKVDEILERGRIPIIVGGTGFYIQALLYDIDFTDSSNILDKVMKSSELSDKNIDSSNILDNYREKLEAIANEEGGPDKLYDKLKEIDPTSAEAIHKNNIRRVIRALEYYHIYNKPISEHNKEQRQKESAYNSAYFVLTMDREVLYDRINKRVDIMKEAGLVEEVKGLMEKGYTRDLTSMQAIGYKELLEAFSAESQSDSSETSESLLDNAFEKIKLNTRHFAKRQLTWFRREKDVIWLDKSTLSDDEILQTIRKELEKKGVI
ncbi:MAG: tRNA (adenosine(37)-N6)-dimethylallyltransferase MiaA [Eubacterium sp.]|nr:tRNA (adenosine(37)-N6)-dimethylallyltransferase MiaA [Eubacterium sp.]